MVFTRLTLMTPKNDDDGEADDDHDDEDVHKDDKVLLHCIYITKMLLTFSLGLVNISG